MTWLANRGILGACTSAAAALAAAQVQHTALPGQDVAAPIVADLATRILALNNGRTAQPIRSTFRTHPQAEIIECPPAMGTRIPLSLSVNLRAVHLGEMNGELAMREALRGQGKHHLVDAGQTPLPLLDDLRLKLPAVSRGTFTSTGPTSVSTVLDRLPLRLLPLFFPAGSCFP
jgi:hypothetical protein